MNDFFGALELELRAAAERSPRRRAPAGYAAGAVAATALVALAVALVAVVVGGGGEPPAQPAASKPAPVGTVIPKGEGNPARLADTTVVATGKAPVLGPWQLEMYWGKALKDPQAGEVYNEAGPCLTVYPLDPPAHSFQASGSCGARGTGKNRGFRVDFVRVPADGRRADGSHVRVREILIFGRAPERASAVVVTSRTLRAVIPLKDGPDSIRGHFFGFATRAGIEHVRVNWIGRDGRPGSRGIRLPDELMRP
jgi:hypothetical protein